MAEPIKVLVVDDSMVFRSFLLRELSDFDDINIIGTAASAADAEEKIKSLKPQVVTLDVEMPGMNGIDFLKSSAALKGLPVIVITSTPTSTFEVLSAGAIDFAKKPLMESQYDMKRFASRLHVMIVNARNAKPAAGRSGAVRPPIAQQGSFHTAPKKNAIIALGASTGGTDALVEVVKHFPADTPPVLIVQHMPAGFTKMYAARLNKECEMSCKEAEDGDRLVPGQIIVAAGEFHLRLEKDAKGYYITSRRGEKVSGHCPSVDVLFESVARTAGADAVGAILTGMGADGAEGLLKMRNAGAYTIGQNEETCVVYGMPCVAYKKGAVVKQLPLNEIGREILSKVR